MPMQPSEVTTEPEVQIAPKNGKSAGKTVTFKRRTQPIEGIDTFDPHGDASPKEKQELAAGASAAKFVARRDNELIKDWLGQLGDRPMVKVSVSRTWPEQFKGMNTTGFLKTFDRLISEEDIQDLYGGGKFSLRIMTPNALGKMSFAGSTVIEIGGDPKLADDGKVVPSTDPLANPLVKAAWDQSNRAREKAEADLERARESAGSSSSASFQQMQMMLKPIEMQLHAAHEEKKLAAIQHAEEKRQFQQQLEEARKPVANPMLDRIFEKTIGDADTRITALKMQHDSEIRTIKENHAADIARLNDRNDRDRDHMVRSNEREVKSLTESFNREISNLKTVLESSAIATKASSEVNSTILQRENDRLARELGEVKSELRLLQAKKEPSIGEKIKEMNDLKELVGGGEEENKGVIGQVFEGIATISQSKDLIDVVKSWGSSTPQPGGGQPGQQQPQQQQQQVIQHQPRYVREKRTARAFQVGPDGQKVPVRKRAPDGTEVDVLVMDPEKIQQAIGLLEMACRNRIKPEVFATSAKASIPEDIMAAIRRDGVDGFLGKVAQLDQASPLNSQEGRNWIRKVGAALLGG